MARYKIRGIAQLVARGIWDAEAGSSSLPSRTTAPEIVGFCVIPTVFRRVKAKPSVTISL